MTLKRVARMPQGSSVDSDERASPGSSKAPHKLPSSSIAEQACRPCIQSRRRWRPAFIDGFFHAVLIQPRRAGRAIAVEMEVIAELAY